MGKSIAAVSNTRLFLCVLAAGHCGLFAPSIHHARSQNCLLFCGGIRFRLLLGAKAETKKKSRCKCLCYFLLVLVIPCFSPENCAFAFACARPQPLNCGTRQLFLRSSGAPHRRRASKGQPSPPPAEQISQHPVHHVPLGRSHKSEGEHGGRWVE